MRISVNILSPLSLKTSSYECLKANQKFTRQGNILREAFLTIPALPTSLPDPSSPCSQSPSTLCYVCYCLTAFQLLTTVHYLSCWTVNSQKPGPGLTHILRYPNEGLSIDFKFIKDYIHIQYLTLMQCFKQHSAGR